MAGVYQLVLGQVDPAGNYWENVFHFNNSEAIISDPWSAAKDLCDTFVSAVLPAFAALLGTDNTCNLMSAKKVSGAGGPTAFEGIATIGTGTGVGVSPVVAADIAVFPGGLANRAGHIYISGFSTGALTSGEWQSPFPATVVAFTGALASMTVTTGGNSVNYGTYTKSTKHCTNAVHFNLKPKPTGMNKRTLPVT
jgi:hypothetical protein